MGRGRNADPAPPSGFAGHLPMDGEEAFYLAATYRLEAVQAVHRSCPRGHKRHLGRLAAVRADHVVHDPGPTAVAVRRAPCRPALRAATGLVLKPPRLIELLLPRRKEKLTPAVATRQRPIHEAHRPGLPLKFALRPGRCRPDTLQRAVAILTRLANIWRHVLTCLYRATTSRSSSSTSTGGASNPLPEAVRVKGTSLRKTVETKAITRITPAKM